MKVVTGLALPILGVAMLFGASPVSGQSSKPVPKAGAKTPEGKKAPATPKTEPAKGGKEAPATAPLTAVPDWIPAVTGLKLAPGGKKWTVEETEHGELTGTVAGEPRAAAEAWQKAAEEAFRGVTVKEATVNGATVVTVFATYLKEEHLEHKAEVEFKPAKGGKNCEVKITYTISGEP